MKIIDLRPAAETVYMRPEDTWVFQFLFRKIEGQNPVNLDVSAFSFVAQLYQKIDTYWVKFPTAFGRKAGMPPVNAIETGIYLDSTDPTKIVFLWDFRDSPEASGLSEGEYRLDFLFTTDQGYDKTFFSYFPILTNNPKEDAYEINSGIKYLLTPLVNSTMIHIHNTIL